ncbi:MAG: nucleotidyltransferase domain-containing protein [Ignavibacteriaceae bacterium]|nr:nucleotidyltransferase domain-containing protein [Ignavibacteriaceae bacterium]
MLSEQLKNQIKERILSKFNPDKIILFGSQARGTADNKSDIDILVIGRVGKDRFKLMDNMSSILISLDYAFDVIVLTNKEFERDKKYPGTVARYAYKEGILLYER